MIGLAEGDVVEIFVQAVLYGLYLASLGQCLRWQFLDESWRLRKDINWAMSIIAIILFLFSTIDLALRLYLAIAAVQGDPRPFKIPGIVTTSLEVSAMLITDAVLIYRCWVVYARSWRIIYLPIFFWILFLVSSILCVVYLGVLINPKNVESIIHALILEYSFWIVFYCANIATNVYATSAIVLRILKVSKDLGSIHGSKRLHNVSRILAESGILYTSTSVLSLGGTITIIWFQLRLFADLTAILNFSMTGIAFNLILIRVAQDRPKTRDDSYSDSQRTHSAAVLSTMQFDQYTREMTSKPAGGEA